MEITTVTLRKHSAASQTSNYDKRSESSMHVGEILFPNYLRKLLNAVKDSSSLGWGKGWKIPHLFAPINKMQILKYCKNIEAISPTQIWAPITRIAVLLQYSCRNDIQLRILVTHSCKELWSMCVTGRYNCVSSALQWKEMSMKASPKESIYSENKIGPTIHPWGTIYSVGEKKDLNNNVNRNTRLYIVWYNNSLFNAVSDIPTLCLSLVRRFSCSVSNAALQVL